ncbi:MAG: nucleotide sugar dehydrogenase, partial [Dehalococcoidales bacterium]
MIKKSQPQQKQKTAHIGVVGMGYVGLIVAACLAKMGHQVTAVDIDEKKVKDINAGRSPVFEPGIDDILKKHKIRATLNPQEMAGAEIIFICVNTPSNAQGAIALDYITKAAEQIATVIKENKNYCTIVVKSTVVPGTTREVILPILESSGKKAGKDFGLCMCPEFLREGKGIQDYMNPDRIVIGEFDKKSGDALAALYRGFKAPIIRVDLTTAEMIKYASNTFLAAKLSFINEIGNICKKLGIDAYKVAEGMGYDERIGNKFLNAGIGFGGS